MQVANGIDGAGAGTRPSGVANVTVGSASVLAREEWDFGDIPEDELAACCYWEYARESAFVRELRQRCLEHWMPLYATDRWWNAPEDSGIRERMETAKSLGPAAE